MCHKTDINKDFRMWISSSHQSSPQERQNIIYYVTLNQNFVFIGDWKNEVKLDSFLSTEGARENKKQDSEKKIFSFATYFH